MYQITLRILSFVGALILTLFISLVVTLAPAHASAILMTDVNAMDCKVFEDAAFWRCDIHYENARIFSGRDVGPDFANGDCVICRNVKNYASKNRLNVILNRDLNWDHPDFLTLTSDEILLPSAR
jgi:hypothetical protein